MNEQDPALSWLRTVESVKARVRESDIYPRLRAWIERSAAVDILDVGCGQGACSGSIELSGRRYVGVDPSPLLLARAMELHASPSRAFLPGSAAALPVADAAVDAAFSVAVWLLLEDLAGAARELDRVLKPRGRFLIITANPDAYAAWTGLYSDVETVGRRFVGTLTIDGMPASRDVLHLHSLREILDSFRAVGLEIHATETFREDRFIAIEGGKP